ncbi:MAG: hypothetical protein Q8J68_06910 [Methanolobus sp.]|uniref:hypothetical protein n=1 Tax=Methanolobus sp. TaxID=1874737 RepID=UPI002731C67A|nr:hypothetical protein [Methanolobus sp.]MDP2216993.1 hypothetical protein [Methanolobus sp.]
MDKIKAKVCVYGSIMQKAPFQSSCPRSGTVPSLAHAKADKINMASGLIYNTDLNGTVIQYTIPMFHLIDSFLALPLESFFVITY